MGSIRKLIVIMVLLLVFSIGFVIIYGVTPKRSEHYTAKLITILNEQEDVIDNMRASRRADMVAFSTYIWNKELVLRLAKRISKETGAKIVLGGPEVSYNSKEIMEQCDCIDYIICGEGEEPLAKLLSGVNVEEIEGITDDPRLPRG